MKKIIYIVIILGIVGGGVYRYLTRPVSAPSNPAPEQTSPFVDNNSPQDFPTYTIGSGSQVEFRIGEVLRGEPFMVVGTADTLSGTIALSENPALERVLSIGEIRINARTFKTDSPQRDGAIGRMILKSENPEYEFIIFAPSIGTEIAIAPNNTFKGSVSGTLTIAGISKPAVFNIQGLASPDMLSGTAETTIKRTDFKLTIPNIPFVANVDEVVTLKATIIAPVK